MTGPRATNWLRSFLAVGLVSLLVMPGKDALAGGPRPKFRAKGEIAIGNPLQLRGVSITKRDFLSACSVPGTQGVDGYVIELPPIFDGVRATAVLSPAKGWTDVLVDLDMIYFSDTCEEIGSAATASDMESGPLPDGTHFVFMAGIMGQKIPFTFQAAEFR